MTDLYLFVGRHADTLSSGRRVAPGDSLRADELDLENDGIDKRFAAEGLLVTKTTADPEPEPEQQAELPPAPDSESEPEVPAEEPPAEEAAPTTSKGGRAARTTSKETK